MSGKKYPELIDRVVLRIDVTYDGGQRLGIDYGIPADQLFTQYRPADEELAEKTKRLWAKLMCEMQNKAKQAPPPKAEEE